MRFSTVLSLGALIAVGVMLYLNSRDAVSSLDAVAAVASDLREEGVEGQALDHDLARQMIDVMEGLIAAPETISDHIEELKTFAASAASWADAAPSPSYELHASVSLRLAAGELRAYALDASIAHLMRARNHLESARSALSGEGTASGPGPGLATGAIRDRLENLQQSQQEQQQELDEAIRH